MPPGTQTGGFSDQAFYATSQRIGPLMRVLAAGAGNEYWQWYADQVGGGFPGGYIGFLHAAQAVDLEARPPVDLPSSKVFYGVGIAALNSNLLDGTDNVQVLFKSSPMGRQSHGYNANNAFVLNIGGERALVRTGRRDIHGSPHHTQWMWHSRSDNSILVNGESQIKHSPAATGRITHFATSDTVDAVEGEAAESYEALTRATRRIVFLKPDALVIHDVLEAGEPATYQWMLHALERFDIDGQRVTAVSEAGRTDTHFLYPQGLDISQTDAYEPPPHEWATFELSEWHLSVDTPEPARKQEFITLVSVNEGVSDFNIEETGAGVRRLRVSTQAGESTIELAEDWFAVAAPGFEERFEYVQE
jgi:hypothetical protein